MMTYQRANRLWMQMLLRDRFKTILLKRLQQGQWISPADFKKYTTPHTHHCFRLYMNRPCAFRRYLSKRHFHKTAKAAVFRLASSGVPQSRLNSRLDPFPREKKFFSPNEANLSRQASGTNKPNPQQITENDANEPNLKNQRLNPFVFIRDNSWQRKNENSQNKPNFQNPKNALTSLFII